MKFITLTAPDGRQHCIKPKDIASIYGYEHNERCPKLFLSEEDSKLTNSEVVFTMISQERGSSWHYRETPKQILQLIEQSKKIKKPKTT